MAYSPKKIINAWSMYDWANSAFATTIQAAVFGVFYTSTVRQAGLGEADATAYWGYTNAVALLLVSLSGPLLGAVADYGGHRKRYLGTFAGIGIVATGCFVLIGEGQYLFASIIFIIANFGFACANIFYDAFLPSICPESGMERVSARGYALGYFGGGILLALNAAWISSPSTFGMADVGTAVKASFVSVAVWWFLFSIPIFRVVPDSRAPGRRDGVSLLSGGFARLGHTFRRIRSYRQLLLFLVAFWIYNDGIGTVYKMAAVYGAELGFDMSVLISGLLVAQFIGIPCTFLFGKLGAVFGSKRMILVGLSVYTLISFGGYFMATPLHYFILAGAVGVVQGGTQALSRALYGSMVPANQAAEFFGFFSTSAKFAGIAGPLIFGMVSQSTGNSRFSIVSLVVFFALGAVILSRVDVEEGIRVAEEEEREDL